MSSTDLSELQHNPFLVGSTLITRSSPVPNGLPRIPLPGGLSRTLVRTTRSGFSGSSSMSAINTHMGLIDVIVDTGVEHGLEYGHESMHEPESPMVQKPHYFGIQGRSNDAASNGSHRPFITRKGYKFGRESIHRAILKIFWQSIYEPWITYRKIPKEVVSQMFECFRWDPNEEGRIREGFENTLKDCYRGRMKDAREASGNSARKSGHVITEINDNFEILANYNPVEIHADVWRRLCRKELTCEDPSFIDLSYKTHLTAKSKKIYFGGDKQAPLDFVNETSREAIESYNKALSQKYGDDLTQHNVNDPELWTQT
ncbi:unnamed protein product [Lactuca saligna]|uniref:Uncharacterized protein n=1 Tax=Lactuca saligna TaxID=75948 RepID=A0AA35ZKU6_LACSI|nr:unnamed protein product [Lactuca saligna]